MAWRPGRRRRAGARRGGSPDPSSGAEQRRDRRGAERATRPSERSVFCSSSSETTRSSCALTPASGTPTARTRARRGASSASGPGARGDACRRSAAGSASRRISSVRREPALRRRARGATTLPASAGKRAAGGTSGSARPAAQSRMTRAFTYVLAQTPMLRAGGSEVWRVTSRRSCRRAAR